MIRGFRLYSRCDDSRSPRMSSNTANKELPLSQLCAVPELVILSSFASHILSIVHNVIFLPFLVLADLEC